MDETDEARLETFRSAVMLRLNDLGESQAWLGRQLGVSRQSVNGWLTESIPPRERVYEVEDALGMQGQLCKIVGYTRPGYDNGLPSLAAVLAADGRLDERARQTLLSLYKTLTGE